MDDSSYDPRTEAALTELIVDSRELERLERRLGSFNIFKVLRADRNELRHSNILAWLLQPEESHGLGDAFLRRWLLLIMNEAARLDPRPIGWISPIKADALAIEFVEVHREWSNIDLLVEIHLNQGPEMVLCIENKVDSSQHGNQLRRYREAVAKRYDSGQRCSCLFLTKNDEPPEDDEFIPTSYDLVAQALGECLEAKGASLAPDPTQLMRHYLDLIRDDFMSDNENARLAQEIYRMHRHALDFIFENKTDVMRQASDALDSLVRSEAHILGVVPYTLGKGYIRFLPKEWAIPSNSGGAAWGEGGRFLVCEVTLWTKKVELHIVSGRAPESWADELWELAKHAPFKQEWKKRPAVYVKPYKAVSSIAVESLTNLASEDMGAKLCDWLKAELSKPSFKNAVEILAALLEKAPVAAAP